MAETRGIIFLLYYTENATLKQTLMGACPTAQRLVSSVLELTETRLQNRQIIANFKCYLPLQVTDSLVERCATQLSMNQRVVSREATDAEMGKARMLAIQISQ